MPVKSIKFNTLMNALRTISTMIFPMITFPYASRILGPEGTGAVNFAVSFVGYFVLLSSIGIPLYGIREVARVRGDKNDLTKVIQELLLLNCVAVLIAIIAFLGFMYSNEKILQEKLLFIVVSSTIIISPLGMGWLYEGLEEYAYITTRSLLFSFVSLIALFVFVQKPKDYVAYAGIYVFSTIGSSIMNLWNAKAMIFRKADGERNVTRHIRPLMTVFGLNFAISIYLNLDTVMLGFMSNSKSVGYYSLSMKLTKMIIMVISSFGAVLLPRLSYHIANGQNEEFDKLLKKSLSVNVFLCLPISLALTILGRNIVLFFVGDKFEESIMCLIVTAPIVLFIGLTGVLGMQILYPLGKERMVAYSVCIGAAISLVLNLVLIPRFAHLGAAIAALGAELAVFAMQLIMVKKVYPIIWPYRDIAKYLAACAVMSLGLIGSRLILNGNFQTLIVSIPLGIALYLGVLWFLKEELTKEMLQVMVVRISDFQRACRRLACSDKSMT